MVHFTFLLLLGEAPEAIISGGSQLANLVHERDVMVVTVDVIDPLDSS